MAEKFVSRRNLEFLLYEVHGVEQLSALPYFADHTRETYRPCNGYCSETGS